MNKLKARREIVKGQKNNNNNKKKLPQEIERSQEINGGLELTGETPSEVNDLGDLQIKTRRQTLRLWRLSRADDVLAAAHVRTHARSPAAVWIVSGAKKSAGGRLLSAS